MKIKVNVSNKETFMVPTKMFKYLFFNSNMTKTVLVLETVKKPWEGKKYIKQQQQQQQHKLKFKMYIYYINASVLFLLLLLLEEGSTVAPTTTVVVVVVTAVLYDCYQVRADLYPGLLGLLGIKIITCFLLS